MTDEERYEVVCQKWEESEKGWGTRPDGYSLHLTGEDRKAFIQEYRDAMPDEPPSEYSRPNGTPYRCVAVKETFEKVRASKNGVRFYGTPPYPGGIDGWISVGSGQTCLRPAV